jgi:hypothetical protein
MGERGLGNMQNASRSGDGAFMRDRTKVSKTSKIQGGAGHCRTINSAHGSINKM